MAKLYFRYGAMNSGKSTSMLQAAYNYEERGHHVLLAKPSVDTKGDRGVLSRLGVTRGVDFLLTPETDAFALFQEHRARVLAESGLDVSCLLVDEAQFLDPGQVDDLFRIAVLDGVPVLAYGLRTDFRGEPFPGSAYLLALADDIEEIKNICTCGKKATMNIRVDENGKRIKEGEQISIGGNESYRQACGRCFYS